MATSIIESRDAEGVSTYVRMDVAMYSTSRPRPTDDGPTADTVGWMVGETGCHIPFRVVAVVHIPTGLPH